MSENSAEVKNDNSVESENQPQEEKSTGRGKRSASKRVSMLTRTAQEGEAILKGMGHKDEASEGRRTTRSSTRGSTGVQATPPPAKRERKTPSSGKGSRRGRPKRDEPEDNEEVDADSKEESKDEEKPTDKEENGKSEELEKKENSLDSTDGDNAAKPMEVDETEKPDSDAAKPIDNGPTEQSSSPDKIEDSPLKADEPEKKEDETTKEEVSSKSDSTEEKTESDTREAPPPPQGE